ncbi:MAG: xylulokinase [Anaerolineae bacterium]|nr:xylulokinase [Anaerolineae bacterium]NUQ05238.1 xylulokinase [Anaerolineae bacterium]
MTAYILAHDLGTSGDKATLYDREGRLCASAFQEYPTDYQPGGRVEQDAGEWWRAVCLTTRRLLQTSGAQPSQVACVVFSGHMQGVVAVDDQGMPLRRAIIWADHRAEDQTARLRERLGEEGFYRITGHRLSPTYSLPKIMWLRDHEPELYARTHRFLHSKEAMIARLTGRFATEPSDATGTGLYDLAAGVWSGAILDASGIDPRTLPPIVASTTVIGEVLPAAAEATGLRAGTPVVIGGGDGACASVGAGSVTPGVGYAYIGSSSWMATATTQPLLDPGRRIVNFGHVIPGMVIPLGAMQAAGGAYRWTRDQLGAAEEALAQAAGTSVYELLNATAEGTPPGANGLIFLPYLLGERAPRWNPRARGAFIGLTMQHTRAHLIRAVLEGVAFNLRAILTVLNDQGAGIESLRVIGGGSVGRFWRQIMADVFGIPLHRLTILEEATSMGAAVIGGVAVGMYPDFEMAQAMNPVADVVSPDPAHRALYDEAAAIFEASYAALIPVFERMAKP